MITNLDETLTLSRQLFWKSRFRSWLNLYKSIQILTFIANHFNKTFLAVVTGMGVVIFASLLLIVITMYGQVPWLLYWSCVLLVVGGILWVMLLPLEIRFAIGFIRNVCGKTSWVLVDILLNCGATLILMNVEQN